MAKQDVIEVEATVIDNLPNAMFKVELSSAASDVYKRQSINCSRFW